MDMIDYNTLDRVRNEVVMDEAGVTELINVKILKVTLKWSGCVKR